MDGRATSPTWGFPPPCKQALSLMNGVLLENFLTTFNYWFTWEEVVGLTSKGKSCLLAVSRKSNHGSFERSLGAGKAVETGSRSIAEESI